MIQEKCMAWALLVVALVTNGCKTKEMAGEQSLEVERQECVMRGINHPITGKPYDIGAAIDAPVKGRQVLMDSIVSFLNQELYEFYESDEPGFLTYDEVATSDSRHLLAHYQEVYKEQLEKDSDRVSFDYLEVVLAAQTDSYVTYESNWSFYGEGLTTSQNWVTFRKSDGRRFDCVISNDNLLRFMDEHPDLRSSDVWGDIQFKLSNGKDVSGLLENTGLVNDSVMHQHCYANGIFETMTYDLPTILPYLSKEVQDLVKGQ